MFRPESYTDDLELAEGLTDGKWLISVEHEKYFPDMHERETNMNFLQFIMAPKQKKGIYYPKFKDDFAKQVGSKNISVPCCNGAEQFSRKPL